MIAKEKFRQMMLPNKSIKPKEEDIETILQRLERRYRKGFVFKTDEGSYAYSPTKVSKSKTYYTQEKRFYPKKGFIRSDIRSN